MSNQTLTIPVLSVCVVVSVTVTCCGTVDVEEWVEWVEVGRVDMVQVEVVRVEVGWVDVGWVEVGRVEVEVNDG